MLRKWLIRIGFTLGGLVVLVAVAYAAVSVIAGARLAKRYEVQVAPVTVTTDAAGIERGRHLVVAVQDCGHCHGADLGGQTMVDDAMLGRVVAPNLTRGQGSAVAGYRDVDWVRSIRHGVRPDGRALAIMPSDLYHQLSADDLGAVVAYVKQVPAVDREHPPVRVGPLGRLLFLTGKLPILAAEKIDHQAGLPAVSAATAAEKGEYLVRTSGCNHCHSKDLMGGPLAAAPPGAPVPPRIARMSEIGWTEAGFVRALRQGVRPDGRQLDDFMPWRAFGRMSDDELHALWVYLETPATMTAALAK